MKAAVLGGGLTGLQLCRRLRAKGVDCVVLESRDVVGGLCRSLRRGAYSWDLGPHAFYSREPAAMDFYRELPVEYHERQRRVRVAHREPGGGIRELHYPFENGLADLPFGHKMECVLGYLRAALCGDRNYRNLEHWIANGLGAGIARHFMTPYNEKIWDCPLDRISMALVRGKIEPEPAWKILRNGFVRGTVGRTYQANFLYPRAGGAGALPEAVAAEIRPHIRTGWPVRELRRSGGGWKVRGAGGEVAADIVVSTIPIPELLGALADQDLSGQAGSFLCNDTYFAVVGLKAGRTFARCGGNHWTFFAGPEAFYRLTMMQPLDPDRPPTVVAEITRRRGAPGLTEGAVTAQVLRGLSETGILAAESDVELAAAHLERCTYPIQTLGLPEAVAGLERRLEEQGLYLLGRSGRWDYLNTDGVFLAVDRFLRETWPRAAERAC
ncbi:MAG: FAD-dependent oxidoreductase [Elusimicrobiota bacterium]